MDIVATGAAGDLVSAGTIRDHRRGRVTLLSPSSPRRSTYRHAVADKVTEPGKVVAFRLVAEEKADVARVGTSCFIVRR